MLTGDQDKTTPAAPTQAERPKESLFRKHLRGDYGLARAFWLHTFFFTGILPPIVLGISWQITDRYPARYGAIMALTTGTVSWLFFWGATWGTWISARRHVQRGGKKFWAVTAKITLVLVSLSSAYSVLDRLHVYPDYYRAAIGRQLGPDTIFQVRVDGKSLLLQGGINDGTADRLARALDAAPGVQTVVLSSEGGWVREGRAIADLIAARNLNTYVEQNCSSACTIAFLGGKDRAAAPEARMGFHTFRSVGASGSDISISLDGKIARKAYGRAGLPEAFIDRVVATPHAKLWYPDHSELLQAHVLTRASAGGETTALATTADTREKLVALFGKVEFFDVLSAKYPREFDRIIDGVWRLVQQKKNDHLINTAMRVDMSALTSRLLPAASDRSLFEFAQLGLNRAEALRPVNSEACVAVLLPEKMASFEVGLSSDLLQKESAFIISMMRNSDDANREFFDKNEVEQKKSQLRALLTPEPKRLNDSLPDRVADPAAACEAVIAYLRILAALPADERKRTLRMLYSQG